MHARISHARASRISGLDGLRAIAVTLVLVYHLFPALLPGGFLGVDVFFVISGFLISTLLIGEHRARGKLALGAFWKRRARRLLPALAIVLLVCTSAALAVGGGELLTNIGAQLAGSAFFVANWVYIALGADYFAVEQPELFRNMWSLAIEEQFYLLLPIVLLIALRMRARASRALFFGALGVTSAVWMSVLFASGASASRVYFGTDTHLFGLLLGVALACAVAQTASQAAKAPRELRAPAQLALIAAAVLGLATLSTLAFTLKEGSPESFAWGLQLAVVATLVTVWAVTRQGALAGRWLDARPLRWVGERSYGIYLWHWPLLLIVTQTLSPASTASAPTDPAAVAVVGALTLSLTFSLATLSYRYVEMPVRRLGLRRAMRRLLQPARWRSARVVALGTAVFALLLVTIPATGIAIANAPAAHVDDSIVSRGQAVLDAQQRAGGGSGGQGPGGEQRPSQSAPSTTGQAGTSRMPEGFDTAWAKQPEFKAPRPDPYEGWQISAIGDSVMLASAPELAQAFPDIWIDAAVSRGLGAGVGIATDLAAQGSLRQVLVVGLGTNGPVDDADLEELRRIAGERPLVLVNAFGDRWWIPEVNAQLAAFADKYRGVTLADWNATIPQVPDGLAPDEIHPNPAGGEAYAQCVRLALDALLERDEQPLRKK